METGEVNNACVIASKIEFVQPSSPASKREIYKKKQVLIGFPNSRELVKKTYDLL